MGRERPPDDYPPDDYGPDDYPTEPLRREPDPDRRTREYEQRRRPPGPPPRRTNPWVWVAVLGLLLAAGVILAIVLVNNDDNSASTVTVTSTTATTGTVTTQPPLVDVPDVRGDTQLSSVSTLQDGGLYANTFPVRGDQQRGTVVAQNPTGGRLAEGSPVRLNVSIGNGDTPEVGVPDVTGSQADDARLSLARSKLCMRTLTRTASSPDEVGTVLTQSPSAGASSSQFAQVTIYVGA